MNILCCVLSYRNGKIYMIYVFVVWHSSVCYSPLSPHSMSEQIGFLLFRLKQNVSAQIKHCFPFLFIIFIFIQPHISMQWHIPSNRLTELPFISCIINYFYFYYLLICLQNCSFVWSFRIGVFESEFPIAPLLISIRSKWNSTAINNNNKKHRQHIRLYLQKR